MNIAEVYAGMRAKEERATADFLDALDYYPISRVLTGNTRVFPMKDLNLYPLPN